MYRRLVAHQLSTNFREATLLETVAKPSDLESGQVLLRVCYVGINASDINFTAGKYQPGVKPPFGVGFEAVGIVERVGPGVRGWSVGDAAASTAYGAFAEYIVAPARRLIPLPRATADMIPLLTSGLTASIALQEKGNLHPKDVVLVTAAAGGTGQFAVQLAALKGCHVIGTCSSPKKAEFLKSIGCARVINYKKEDLHTVLRKEYAKGVDVVYESVGGKFFDTCVRNLAVKGRLIVIGAISGYRDGSAWAHAAPKRLPLQMKLLTLSAEVHGFFLIHYADKWREHVDLLSTLVSDGRLKSVVDMPCSGIESVADAIDFMYEGKNVGKVVVPISPTQSSRL